VKTIALLLAVAAATVSALAGDSECGGNTFILQDGTTTRVSGSMDDLNRFEAKMRQISEPALFMRIDGKDYVISDPTVVDRARAIFFRSMPIKAEKRALKQERQDLLRRQHQLEARGGNETEAAELDAEERSLEEQQGRHDAERERVSREMSAALNDLAREAIRTRKAL
jgi:hypothetical protein